MPTSFKVVPLIVPKARDRPETPRTLAFGVFQFDVSTGQLRRSGIPVQLHGQPLQVLEALLKRPGDIIAREELRSLLWPSDTFVDFEHSLNAAVKRLREALGDSADNPRFIQTLPRHGYRFIATVADPERKRHRSVIFAVIWIFSLFGVAVLAATFGLHWRQASLNRAHAGAIRSLAVLPLENISGNPEDAYFCEQMTEQLITELAEVREFRVISRRSVMRYKGTDKSLAQIARELQVEALVQGSALRIGDRVRVTVQLIRAAPEEHLWAESYERDSKDVMALQAEVSRLIAAEIKRTVGLDSNLSQESQENDEQITLLITGVS